MKKVLLIAASALALVTVAGASLAHSGGVYTAQKVDNSSIVVDGVLGDAGWAGAQAEPIGLAVPAWQQFKTQVAAFDEPFGPADISAKFKVAYNDESLFLAFDVTDDKFVSDGKAVVFNYDTIEVWMDGLGQATGKHKSGQDADIKFSAKLADGKAAVEAQRMDTGKDAWGGAVLTALPGVAVAGTVSNTGYTVEAKLPWAVLEPWIGKHAADLGFDVQINDNDKGVDAKKAGIRSTELIWSGGKDNDYQDTALFGDLLLR